MRATLNFELLILLLSPYVLSMDSYRSKGKDRAFQLQAPILSSYLQRLHLFAARTSRPYKFQFQQQKAESITWLPFSNFSEMLYKMMEQYILPHHLKFGVLFHGELHSPLRL